MNIYKYPIKVTDWQFVDMPKGAKILTVQMQHETPCIWAMVDPQVNPYVARKIHIYGTGHEIPDTLNLDYIGTFQMHDGYLVLHAFEAKDDAA